MDLVCAENCVKTVSSPAAFGEKIFATHRVAYIHESFVNDGNFTFVLVRIIAHVTVYRHVGPPVGCRSVPRVRDRVDREWRGLGVRRRGVDRAECGDRLRHRLAEHGTPLVRLVRNSW